MKSQLLFLCLCFSISFSSAQLIYKGFIGKYPIELAVDVTDEDVFHAYYLYTNYGTSIHLMGTIKSTQLVLLEMEKRKESFNIDNFNPNSMSLEGTWYDNYETRNKQLAVKLQKVADLGSNYFNNVEFLQSASLTNLYFKVMLSKESGDYAPRVTGVKVYEKKTNRLVQKISLDGVSFSGFNCVEKGDFNFDGYEDFSVFESSYAGPNTSSLYYLYDASTGKFFDSGFEGVSLEFDYEKKRITEVNSCCAGTSTTEIIYKVVNNKMVELERHCYKYDDRLEEQVERPFSECQ